LLVTGATLCYIVVYAVALCLFVVCLSVRPSQAGLVPHRLNVAARKQQGL